MRLRLIVPAQMWALTTAFILLLAFLHTSPLFSQSAGNETTRDTVLTRKLLTVRSEIERIRRTVPIRIDSVATCAPNNIICRRVWRRYVGYSRAETIKALRVSETLLLNTLPGEEYRALRDYFALRYVETGAEAANRRTLYQSEVDQEWRLRMQAIDRALTAAAEGHITLRIDAVPVGAVVEINYYEDTPFKRVKANNPVTGLGPGGVYKFHVYSDGYKPDRGILDFVDDPGRTLACVLHHAAYSGNTPACYQKP